jgi:hypothetical protein
MSFTTSATNITASGKTGYFCSKSGPYRSGSGVVVFFKQGDKFTVDPASGRTTTWSTLSGFDSFASSSTV